MAHTHEFDCPVCGAHLESRDQLNEHCEVVHPDDTRSARPAGGLSYRDRSSRRDRDTRRD